MTDICRHLFSNVCHPKIRRIFVMAYSTGTLTYIAGGPIEGAWKLWEYTTTDTLAQVTAAGYITDATFKGMSLGDFVIVVNQTNPQGYILQVQSLTTGTMSVSGTATLAAPAGVGGSQLAFPRNIVDGGDFTTNPWQRGTSFTAIASTLTYTADRFFAVGGAASSISVSQVTGVTAVPGFSQALQFGRAAANANTVVITLGQIVETLDAIRAQGQTVTLSFWALAGANWSPASGNLNVQLVSGTGTNQSAASAVAGTWTGFSSLTLTPAQGTAAAAANIAQPITTRRAMRSLRKFPQAAPSLVFCSTRHRSALPALRTSCRSWVCNSRSARRPPRSNTATSNWNWQSPSATSSTFRSLRQAWWWVPAWWRAPLRRSSLFRCRCRCVQRRPSRCRQAPSSSTLRASRRQLAPSRRAPRTRRTTSA